MAEELNLDHFDLGTFVDYVHALKQERDALRALLPSQGGEAVAWRVTGRDGLTVTAQYPEWAEADCLLTITPLYTHPADQVAEDLRDLLERALPYLNNTPDLVQFGAEELAGEIRALLSKP